MENGYDLKVIFWGYTHVLCINWSASYMDVYIYQTTFKIYGFHYTRIVAQFKKKKKLVDGEISR